MKLMKKVLKIVGIVLPILLALGVAGYYLWQMPSKAKVEKYSEIIATANSQYEQKEYAKAMNGYNSAAEIVNSKKEAYEGIVRILLNKHQLGQIVDILEKSAIKLDANSQAELYSSLAGGYLEANNTEYALRYFEKALSLNSGLETGKIGIAKTYLKMGDYTKALSYLDLPNTSSNYLNNYLLKLFAKFNNLAAIQEILAETVATTAEVDKRIVDDFKVVAKQTFDNDIYIAALLARIYINNGYPKLAVSLLEPMKDEKIAEYPDGLYFLARGYYDTASYASCISILKDFPNITGRYDVFALLARAYVKTGDLTQAMKYYGSAISTAGDKGEAIYQEYIEYLIAQAQYSKANDTLLAAAKKFDDPWVYIDYVNLYVADKNQPKVWYYLDKLGKRTDLTDLQKKEYLNLLVTYYIDNQKYTEAGQSLVTLKDLDKYNPWYYLLNGKLQLQNANTSVAKENLEKAIDYDLSGEVTQTAKKLLSRIE